MKSKDNGSRGFAGPGKPKARSCLPIEFKDEKKERSTQRQIGMDLC